MTQTQTKPSIADLLSTACQLVERLDRRIEDRDQALNDHDRPGSAKQIALITLALELRCGLRRDLALSLAAKAVGGRLPITPGGLKRSASEARAILCYGLEPDWRRRISALDALSDFDLVGALEELVRQVNISAAVAARAGALSGAKGGRPRRSPPRTSAFGRASGEPITPDDVVEHVQHLIRMGAQGNPEARSRLVEIDQEIRSWLHLEVSRFATSRSAGYERRLRGSPQPMDMESAAE